MDQSKIEINYHIQMNGGGARRRDNKINNVCLLEMRQVKEHGN